MGAKAESYSWSRSLFHYLANTLPVSLSQALSLSRGEHGTAPQWVDNLDSGQPQTWKGLPG